MKKYNSYKDSGIDWIGEVPEHWNLCKIKFLVKCNLEVLSERTSPNEQICYIEIGDVNSDQGIAQFSEYTFSSAPSRARRVIRKGDIIVSTVRTYLKAIASVTDAFDGFIASTGFAVLTPVMINSDFLGKAILVDGLIGEIISLSRGVSYPSITAEELLNIKIPFPSTNEQIAIASFLENKIKQIDALISKKEKLIELLNDERTALINQAVTKGLNPDAPMKDSGIEWIGEVPEHWDVLSFRYIIDVLTDYTANGSFASLAENVNYLDSGYSRLVRLTDLRVNLNNEGLFVDEKAHNFLKKSELFGGEILIANVGAYAGLTLIMPELEGKFTLGPNMFLLRLNQNTNYFNFLLNSPVCAEQLKMMAISSAQPKLNKDNIRELKVIKPPVEEQESIVSYIFEENNRIDDLLKLMIKEIDLLKEYRTALISEVVTGKVDVRDEKVF